MVNPRIAYFVFLGLFAAERMVELVLSARNVHRALHRGAVEQGRGHYPVMVAFHCAALVACAIVAASQPAPPAPNSQTDSSGGERGATPGDRR